MISRSTGEVCFEDGLSFSPHVMLSPDHVRSFRSHSFLSIPGWTQHFLGKHTSEERVFEVEAVSDPACRIQAVFLAHSHPFYQSDTPGDKERRVFHEGIIASELGGQLEFSWGEVFCRLDVKSNTDWLVIIYTPGPNVPLHPPEMLQHLYASKSL